MPTMLLPFKDKEAKRIPERLLCIEQLIIYLTRLNDSNMVYVKRIYKDSENGNKIYEMSNGISYTKDVNGEWFIV